MSKKQTEDEKMRTGRYEYRVWGKHPDARKKLEKLATNVEKERVNDCYLIVDDASWNAKVRDNTLKLKQLVEHDKGFQRWASDRYTDSQPTEPQFDEIFARLRLDRAQRGKTYDLRRAVKRLDESSGVRAVFVTKKRRHYSVGDLWAEVTSIELRDSGDVLYSLSIEGDDLDELIALRKHLGLRDEPNIAVHEAIEAEIL